MCKTMSEDVRTFSIIGDFILRTSLFRPFLTPPWLAGSGWLSGWQAPAGWALCHGGQLRGGSAALPDHKMQEIPGTRSKPPEPLQLEAVWGKTQG